MKKQLSCALLATSIFALNALPVQAAKKTKITSLAILEGPGLWSSFHLCGLHLSAHPARNINILYSASCLFHEKVRCVLDTLMIFN